MVEKTQGEEGSERFKEAAEGSDRKGEKERMEREEIGEGVQSHSIDEEEGGCVRLLVETT